MLGLFRLPRLYISGHSLPEQSRLGAKVSLRPWTSSVISSARIFWAIRCLLDFYSVSAATLGRMMGVCGRTLCSVMISSIRSRGSKVNRRRYFPTSSSVDRIKNWASAIILY
jgi:hypothetical protein